MSKLYIGNLPAECNEAALRQLLTEQAINVSSVLVKRGGYAFIDCTEQATIDRAIQQLNGNILLLLLFLSLLSLSLLMCCCLCPSLPPPPASHFIIVVVVIGRPICGWKLRFDGLTVAGGDGPFLSSAPSSAGRRGRLEGLSDLKRQCNSSSTFNHFPSPDSPISGADEGQALIPASIRPRAMPPRAIPIGFVSIPSNLPRARVCVCLIIIRSSAYFYDARSINKMMAVALACACCRDTDVARLDNASIEARSAPSP